MDEIVIVDDNGEEHIFPAGFDPKRAAEIVRTRTAKPGMMEQIGQGIMRGDFLPTAGAMAGGIIGGIGGTVGGVGIGGVPGAIGGSAVGGAAGEAVRQLYQRFTGQGDVPATPLDAAKQIGIVAGTEGATQAAGGVVGKGLSLAGKGFYKGAVGMLPRTLKQEFPELAEAGFKEGIPLTGRGADKASRLASESADKADDLIAQRASQTAQVLGPSNPGKVPGFVALPEALAEVPEMMRAATQGALGTKEPARRQIASLARKTATGHQWPMQLPAAQALKRSEQDSAQGIYRAMDKGAHVPAIDRTRAQFAKAVAGGTRQAIEREVPEVAAVNARTQSLLGLDRAADYAAHTGNLLPRLMGAGVGAGLASPAGVVPALTGAALAGAVTSPGGLSTLGLAGKSLAPMAAHGLPGAKRAIDLIREMYPGESPDVQEALAAMMEQEAQER